MLSISKQRLGRDDEQGFTLIELMIVVLIIAILLAIAIPTFLGARSSANSRAAQSSLRNALSAEQAYFTNNQSFGSTAAQMNTIEPNLTWLAAAPTSAGPNSVFAATIDSGNQVFLQVYGSDGKCYTIFQNDDVSNQTTGGDTGYAIGSAASTPGTCAAVTTAPASVTSGSAAGAGATNYGTYYSSW